MKKSTVNLYFNITGLVFSALGGPFVALQMTWPEDSEKFSKAVLLCVICTIVVLIYCAFAYMASGGAATWVKPSLKYRLYISGQPLQNFFLGGLVFLAMSLGCMVGALWISVGYAWVLFSSVGVGCLLGVLFSKFILKIK